MGRRLLLDEPIWFGKHEGLSVRAIAKFDPAYLLWIKQNTSIEWDDEALKIAKAAWSRDYYQKLEYQNGWAWGFGRAVRSASIASRNHRIKVELDERLKAGLEPHP